MSTGWFGRWLKFNGAGLLGVGVQTTALAVLGHAGVAYLVATVLAVECAVLHNFLWHERWTWRQRARSEPHRWMQRLMRFHLANGLISLCGNVLLMAWLVGVLGGPLVLSNLIAICICATANFVAGDRFVFRLREVATHPKTR